MKRTIILSFCLALLMIPGLAQEWRKIVPLKTKCEELKKILSVKQCQYPASNYDFEEFTININFHRKYDNWEVSSDTVVDVTIILHKLITLKDFEPDLSGYNIKPETDIPALIYTNDKKGIRFVTEKPEGDQEYVMGVSLFPIKTNKK